MQEKALRYNSDKVRLSLVPGLFITELAKVFEAGAVKYAVNNWMKSLNTDDHSNFVRDRFDSLLRHVNAYHNGEWLDIETKCPHLVQVAWNALVIVWYTLQEHNQDIVLPKQGWVNKPMDELYPRLHQREASDKLGGPKL